MGLVDRGITKDGMENKGGEIGSLKGRGTHCLVISGKEKKKVRIHIDTDVML